MKTRVVAAALSAVLLFAGCTSQPKPQKLAGLALEGPAAHPPTAIEHRNSATGAAIPPWVLMEQAAIEKLPENRASAVFIFRKDGPDLDSLTAWSRGFPFAPEIAREIVDRARRKVLGDPYENRGAVASYGEEAAKVVEAAEYAGTLRRDEFWVHMQLYSEKGKPAEKIFRYLLLYTVPQEQIAAAIQRAFREQDRRRAAGSPDEQAARDWIKALFLEGL
jgi:hypothetical protein